MNIIGRNCRCLTVWCFKNGLEGHKTHFVWVQKLRKAFLVGGGWKCFHGSYLWNSLKKEVPRSRRRQSCDRNYASGLRWAIRACWCHHRGLRGTQGSSVEGGGWHLFILCLLGSVWKCNDVLPIKTGGRTTTSLPPLRLPTWFSPPLASPASAPLHGLPTPPLSRVGWGGGGRRETGRGQEKKCEMKAQQFTSHAAAEDSTANQPDLNDYMTGNKDIFQLRQ